MDGGRKMLVLYAIHRLALLLCHPSHQINALLTRLSPTVTSLFFVHGIFWRFFWGRCIRNLLEMGFFLGSKLGGPYIGVASFSECGGESSWRQSETAGEGRRMIERGKVSCALRPSVFT
jgi:hypothetical protein